MGQSVSMSKPIGKNTVVGVSLGTLVAVFVAVWTMLDIGRPLFASDLVRIEQSIHVMDVKNSLAICNLAKQGLKSELRGARRELREDPDNRHIEEDIEDIQSEIKDLDTKIACYRTVGCIVEEDF